jgi:hypothetical protein
MSRELTGTEMQKVWTTYLSRESETHKRDIQRAEGKVTEIDELLTRVQNTCKFCGEYIYKYSDEDRMGEHVKVKHPQEPEPELAQS